MRILKIIFFYILAVCAVEAQVLEEEVLSNPRMLDANGNIYSSHCADCTAMMGNQTKQCPEFYSYIIDELLRPSIYSFLVGEKPMDVCQKNQSGYSGPKELNALLSIIYAKDFKVDNEKLMACFTQKKLEGKDSATQRKILTAYFHGLNSNIVDLQKRKLEEIASLDSMLKSETLKGINCYEQEDYCRTLKKCNENNHFNETVTFSMTSIKELAELEEQLDDLRTKHIRHQDNFTKEEYLDILNDVKGKIAYLRSITPWITGDEVFEKLKDIKKAIKNNQDEKAEAFFRESFIKQLKNVREIERRNYARLNIAHECLKSGTYCSPNLMEDMNKFYEKQDNTTYLKLGASKDSTMEVNSLKSAGNCLADLKSYKEGVGETNTMVGSTLVGILTGGAGGFLKLGSSALKFYQAGNRIKGLSSMALLSAETKVLSDSYTTISNNCKRDMEAVKNASDQSDGNICTDKGKGIFKYTNLRSCIVNISLTTVPHILGLRGLQGKTRQVASTAEDLALEQRNIISKITNPFFKVKEREELASSLQRLHLTPEELESVLTNLNQVVKTEIDKNRMNNYINFVLSLRPEEQKLAINQLHEVALLSSNMSPGSYVQRFYNKENKFYLYEQFKANEYKKSLVKRGESEEKALEMGKLLARESRAKLQRRYYSCQSKVVTNEHKIAAQRYLGISLALGVSGTVYGNYSANKDKFESNTGEWFTKLGYDIAMTFLMTKLSAKMVAPTSASVGAKYIQSNIDSAMVGSIDAVVYSKLYGVSKEAAIEKLEKIKNSSEAQKELRILAAYIEKENPLEKFVDSTLSSYKKILNSSDKEKILGKPPYLIGDETFPDLTAADLDKPEVKNRLAMAVFKQMNSGENDPLIASGDKGGDRWINDRVWNMAVGVPKGMLVGMGVYQVLCLGIDYPFASLGIVTGMQFANQFISSEAYYNFRKKMIGQ